MPDVSPPKWHLAHVSWFFETFVLQPYLSGYVPFNPLFQTLFNSYYDTVGDCFPRPQRGLLSRPTVSEVYQYRSHVDRHMESLLMQTKHRHVDEIVRRTILGCHHEQQHQELLLTDVKYNFSINPLRPTYTETRYKGPGRRPSMQWQNYEGGIVQLGSLGETFCFDNELPRHNVFLQPYKLATRLVTNGEYLEFMRDGGYDRVELWLSDGWRLRRQQQWSAPLYWENDDGTWKYMTLSGYRSVNENEPVCHVSFYEAEAYARWADKRLPTESEWEQAVAGEQIAGNFQDAGYFHPVASVESGGMNQLFGDVWEWTQSAYSPYPGYRPLPGSLGEYNGKFMSGQMVLRGGSCVTPQNHIRPTYRNFFYPGDRWQFSGIRLAE
jgi:ergothioneine biosynthesis protein EgtB